MPSRSLPPGFATLTLRLLAIRFAGPVEFSAPAQLFGHRLLLWSEQLQCLADSSDGLGKSAGFGISRRKRI
jgi:hypothetical protein